MFYIHDPMCSWCWGHRPVWDEVQSQLAGAIAVQYIVGGLAADSALPMSASQRETIQGHWRRIHTMLGTPFNFDFWRLNTPRRSTYMACRAVLAAKLQDQEQPMIDAIQRAYYLRALNPSDPAVLTGLAEELAMAGERLDTARFSTDLHSAAIEQQLQQQISLARDLTGQGFPSMVLAHQGVRTMVTLDYRDPEPTLEHIRQVLRQ